MSFNSLSRDHRIKPCWPFGSTGDSGLSTPSLGITTAVTTCVDCDVKLCLSTPSLGITRHSGNCSVALERDSFQLPLSGSHQVIPSASNNNTTNFQLPLSGSLICTECMRIRMIDFQLPLSGSLGRFVSHTMESTENLSTPSLGITKFIRALRKFFEEP